jgi:hypothetical protein
MSLALILTSLSLSVAVPPGPATPPIEPIMRPIAPDPAATTTPSASPTEWTVLRVAGDMEIQVAFADGVYTSGNARIDTPLPVGYPPPTAPGAIELKRYPIVRRAEVSSASPADMGMNIAFWPLFKHIQRRDIEMTSPVEMDYRGMDDGTPDGWTMSFLYRRVDQGPTGKDGMITVQDAPPMTVIAIGMTSSYGTRSFAEGLDALDAWLASQTAWERAGDPRAMHYNGPDVRPQDRWMEVQIPVRTRTPIEVQALDRPESPATPPTPQTPPTPTEPEPSVAP